MLFTVEIKDGAGLKEGKTEVQLFLDKEALADLLQQLSFFKKKGDHAHFMTQSWGGGELSEDKQNPESTIINHLKIYYLGQD